MKQERQDKKKNKKKNKKKTREKSVFRDYFELIAETAVFVFFVMTFVVQAFQIPTGSMEDTLLVGDFLLVNKFAYTEPVLPLEKHILPNKELEKGDIVVFKYPKELSKDFVKRLIAEEGDTVEIIDKQVYVNDQPVEEEYKIHKHDQVYSRNDNFHYDDYIRDNFGPVKVPPGHVFVLGDNRDNSMDSRYWGFLPADNIKGRPWLIYFSYQAERDAYLRSSLRDRLKKMIQFIPRARWNRVLKVIR
ncbi:MAG: signal peptidase I [Candidatus Aminicenantes bacterium]